MKNKIKKIITTSVISAVTLTAIGCSANNKIACGSEKCQNMVSRSSKLEIVETASAKAPSRNIGKIVETSSNQNNAINLYNKNGLTYLNENISEPELENSLVNKTDKFGLFILSNTPYISLTSDDNNSLNLNLKFPKIQTIETSNESSIESTTKSNAYNLKRSILMIYVNELHSGNITLSNENKTMLNSYLSAVKNNENNIDENIKNIDYIINILESNLNPISKFYNSNLSGIYNTSVSRFKNTETIDNITEQSTNEQIANKIACTFNFCNLNDSDKIEQKSTNSINSIQRNRTLTSLNNTQNSGIQTQSNQLNNQTQNSTLSNNNQNTTALNNNGYRRTPSSVRHRRMHNQNNAINSSALDIKQEEYRMNSMNQNRTNTNQNFNNSRSVMENSKTMRAERTPENLTSEEYTTTSSNLTNEPRATRVPFSAPTNNFQR